MVEAVAADGYEATSVKQLIGLAGVSRRSFYEQFANKQECFLATFDLLAQRGSSRTSERTATLTASSSRSGCAARSERSPAAPRDAKATDAAARGPAEAGSHRHRPPVPGERGLRAHAGRGLRRLRAGGLTAPAGAARDRRRRAGGDRAAARPPGARTAISGTRAGPAAWMMLFASPRRVRWRPRMRRRAGPDTRAPPRPTGGAAAPPAGAARTSRARLLDTCCA